MESILKNKQYRLMFYGLSFSVLLVLALVRFSLLPWWDPKLSGTAVKILAQLIDSLSSSLIVTILVGTFIFFATPPIVRLASIEPVDPRSISQLLSEASSTSAHWVLRGAMGRYTRAETLPSMLKAAKQSGVTRSIKLVLLDPDCSGSCTSYAAYRNGVASAKTSDPLTEQIVREHIITTILSAVHVQNTEPMMQIEVYLSPMWSTLRVDLSDSYAILTSEDPRDPGLRVDQGSHFYGTYSKELDFVIRQSRRLPHADASYIKPCTAADVNHLLQMLGIQCRPSPEGCERIIRLAESRGHQYA